MVKQEPADEIGGGGGGSLDGLSDDNNNKSFHATIIGGAILGRNPPPTPAGNGVNSLNNSPLPGSGGPTHTFHYGSDANNNNKSSEVNRNGTHLFAGGGGELFRSPNGLGGGGALDNGIKVEKCYYANDRNNNNDESRDNNSWFCQEAEEDDDDDDGDEEDNNESVHVKIEGQIDERAVAADRKSMYPKKHT